MAEIITILIGIVLTTWGSVALLGWPWWIVPAFYAGCFVLGFFTRIGEWILRVTGAIDE